jgi:hypothetical protein
MGHVDAPITKVVLLESIPQDCVQCRRAPVVVYVGMPTEKNGRKSQTAESHCRNSMGITPIEYR